MLEFDIAAMSCGHCVSRITQAIRSVDPDARVEADLAAHKVRVQTERDRDALAAALTEAGYAPDR